MKKCNIVPQVFNSTALVDSELFKSILATKVTRPVAKRIYEAYNSNEFKAVFGDWTLYQAIKFDKATVQQRSTFQSLYNGDLKELERTIDLDNLNELFEPIYNLTNRGISEGATNAKFESKKSLELLAKSLGLTTKEFENYLTSKGNVITYRFENTTIAPVKGGDSFLSLDVVNSEVLMEDMDNYEVQYLDNLISSIVIDNHDELTELINKEARTKKTTLLQVETINKYITNKIKDFKNTLISNIETIEQAKAKLGDELAVEKNKFYKQKIEDNYNYLIQEFNKIQDDGRRSFLYRSFKAHLAKHFDIHIATVDTTVELEDYDNDGNFVSREENPAEYLTKGAMKTNKIKNVQKDLKLLISKSIIKNTFENIGKNIDLSNKYGVSDILTIEDVWGTLISLVTETSGNFDKFMVLAKNVNYLKYNNKLDYFLKSLETDVNIRNSFYSSLNLSVMPNIAMQISTNYSGNTNVTNKQNNYSAFAENVAYEDVFNDIQISLENNVDYAKKVVSTFKKEDNGSYSFKNIIEDIRANQKPINWIVKQLDNLGIANKVGKKEIETYILNKLGFNIDSTTNFEKLMNSDAAIHTAYIQEINKIIDNLVHTSLSINSIAKDYNKLKDNSKAKNNFKFRQKLAKGKKNIRSIAKLAIMNYYGSTNNSYLNVNKDTEQSPQYHSYLSTFLDAMTPINEVIDFENAKEKLSEFLNSPLLANNKFLYNIKGGFGLFNVAYKNGNVEYNSNGTPIITGINTNFQANFRKQMFNGLTNKDISQGMLYDELTGNSWDIVSITNALTGTHTFHSGDSPRSFSITLAKYGLRGLVFDESGNYVSLTDIRDNIGIIKPDGTQRTVEDINEDSLFYFEGTNPLNRDSLPYTKTYKEILTAKEDTLNLRNSLASLFTAFYLSIRANTKDLTKLKYFNHPTILKLVETKGYSENLEESLEAVKLLIKEISTAIDNDLVGGTFISDVLSGDTTKLDFNNENIDIFKFKDFILSYTFNDKSFKQHKNVFERDYTSYLQTESYSDINVLLKQDGELINRIAAQRESILMSTIYDTILDEVNVIKTAAPQLFKYNYKQVGDKSIVESVELTDFAKNHTKELHTVADYNGSEVTKKDSENRQIPTGKALYFNRMSYIENGEKITLNDYIISKLGGAKYISQNDVIDLVLRAYKSTHPLANTLSEEKLGEDYSKNNKLLTDLIYEFIDKVLIYNQQLIIDKSSAFKDEIMTRYVSIPPYVGGTHPNLEYVNGERENVKLLDVNLKSNKEVIENEEEVSEADLTEEEVKQRNQANYEKLDIGYRKSMLEVFINDYIYHTQLSEDLVNGRPYEYKDALDVNKRAPQIFKNGKSNVSDKTFSSVVFGDIEVVTNMLDKLSKTSNLDKTIIHNRYLKTLKGTAKTAEVGNGLSMITVAEFKKRLEVANMWNGKLKEYVEALTDESIPFDARKYDYVAEQLKYFLYARQVSNHGTLKGNVNSYQEKNSTIVLFPKLYKGTEFGVIAEWMERKGVDSANFLSGAKVGGAPVFSIHDIFTEDIDDLKDVPVGYTLKKSIVDGKVILDDRIDRNGDFSEVNTINIEDYKVYHKLSNLRVQQETVSHLLDEKGILSTQLIKRFLTNLFTDQEFTIGEGNNILKFKGKGTKDNPGLFEMFQYALSYNAEQSRDLLLSMWGGIKDGKVNYRADGTIEIDVNKIRQTIQEWAEGSGDINLMRAFEPSADNKVEPLLDFNFPTINKTIEQIGQSIVTKRVTRQTLKQIHGTIVPDLFLTPAMSFRNSNIESMDSDVMKDFMNKGWISFTKEFDLQSQSKGKIELESEYDYIDNQGNPVIKRAQVILNLWDSKLDIYRKQRTVIVKGQEVKEWYIDINAIDPEVLRMIATRIPNEGMQSAMVLEVVGIMNTSASMIIVPQQLALQTGWDYDIDSLYIYPRHLYERTDGQIATISMQWDTNNPDTAFDTDYNKKLNYFKTYYSSKYNNLKNLKDSKVYKAKDKYQKEFGKLAMDSQEDNKAKVLKIESAIKKRDLGSLSVDEFETVVKKVLELGEDISTPNLETLRRYISIARNTKEIRNTYTTYAEILNEAISDVVESNDTKITKKGIILKDLNDIFSEKHFKYTPSFKEESAKLKEQLEQELVDIQLEFTENIDKALSDKSLIDNFNKLPSLKQSSREVRDNLIVDLIESRLLHPESNIHRTKPNEFDNSESVHNHINKRYGRNSSNMNFSQYSDRNDLRNSNINSKDSKGTSVSLDNFESIGNTINLKTGNGKALVAKLTFEEFGDLDVNQQVKMLDETFGYNNYKKVDDGYIVFSTNLGNNASNTGKNVLGKFISAEAAEITAHILDIVKKQGHPNFNNSTLPIVTIFANSGIAHKTSITGKELETSLAYPNMILAQPVVGNYLDKIDSNKRQGEYADKNSAIKNISNDLYAQVISLISKIDLLSGNLNVAKSTTILDIAIHVLSQSEDYDSSLLRKLLNGWKTNIENNIPIKLYNDSKIDVYSVLNSFIDMLSEDNILGAIENYFNNRIGTAESAKLVNSIKDSKQITLIKSMSKIPRSRGKLFTYGKDGFTNVDVDSIKSLKELDTMLKDAIDNNYLNYDSAYKRISLSDNFNSIESYTTYIKNQLQVLKHFEQSNETYNLISKAQLVLKTEKLGTSPNSTVTDKLRQDLDELYIDSREFERMMANTKIFSLSDVDKFRREYHNAKNIKSTVDEKGNIITEGKIDIVKSYILQSKGELKEDSIPYTQLFVNGNTQIAQAIFPNYINGNTNSEFDFRDSQYPYFEAQLVYSNIFSSQVFSDIFIFEKPEYKTLLNNIMAEFSLESVSQVKKSAIVNSIKSAIINRHIINTVPFFNGTYDGRTADEEILRVVGEVTVEKGTIKRKDKTENVNSITKGGTIETNIPEFEEYSNLSTANQIYLLQNNLALLNVKHGKVSDYSEVQQFLKIFSLSLTNNSIIDNGYHRFSVKDNGQDAIKLQQVFNKLYFNNNEYIRQTARDMIRYSFYTSGLMFGYNIAKYIDLSLYYKDFKAYDAIGEDFNDRLSRTNESIKQLRYDGNIGTSEEDVTSITDIVRKQLFDDNYINPKVIIGKQVSENQPTFDNYLEVNGVKQPIIYELASKIKDSKYNRYKSLKIKIKDSFGIGDIVGFKKVEYKNCAYVYYYPFSKSLPFELGTSANGTVISNYRGNIQSSGYYEAMTLEHANANTIVTEDSHNSELLFEESKDLIVNGEYKQNVGNSYNYHTPLTVSNKSYTDTAKDIIDNSDVVLYIGKDNFYKQAFKSDKTLFTTIEDFNINILDNVDFTKPINLSIVGDTLSNNTIEQDKYDSILVPYLSMLARIANLKNIRTIYKTGVGESVFKSTFNKNIPTEFITVGNKDTINEVVYNSETLYREFDVNSVELDLNNLVNKLTNNTAVLSRLYSHSKNTPEMSSDVLKLNVFETRDNIKNMRNTEIRFSAIANSLETITDKVNSIVMILMYDTVSINNTTKHTMFDLPIFKYMSEDNTSVKTLISKKLLNYKNLIRVAKILIDMKTLEVPSLSAEHINNLSIEEQEQYNELVNGIKKINDAIFKLKNSKIQGEDGNLKVFSNDETKETIIDTLETNINLAIAQYFVTIAFNTTRNEKFANSKFTKILYKLRYPNENNNESINVTANELSELYNELITYNTDITSTQYYLDSYWDSGITLVDTTRHLLTEIKINNEIQQIAKLKELKNIVKTNKSLSKFSTDDRTIFTHNKYREQMFMKHINPETGKFYTMYDWNEVYADWSKAKVRDAKYSDISNYVNNKSKRDVSFEYYMLSNSIEKHPDYSRVDSGNFASLQNPINYFVNLLDDNNLDDNTKELLAEFKRKHLISSVNGVDTYMFAKIHFGEYKMDVHVKIENNKLYGKNWKTASYVTIKNEYLSLEDIKYIEPNYFSNDSTPGEIGKYEEIPANIRQINSDGEEVIVPNPEFEYYYNIWEQHSLSLNSDEASRFEKKYHVNVEIKGYVESLERTNTRNRNVNNPNYIDPRIKGDVFIIRKMIPNDKYLSDKYKNVSAEDIKMIKDIQEYLDNIVGMVFPTKYLDDSFIPYLFISHQLGIKDSAKKFINWQSIQKENTTSDIFGEGQVHYFKSHSLTMPSIKNLIRVSAKNPNESIFEYEERVIKKANEKLVKLKEKHKEFKDVKPFKSREELEEFNHQIVISYVKSNRDNLNYDMVSVLRDLTLELFDIKSKQEFSYTYELLTNVMSHESFQARGEGLNGRNLVDSAYSAITGKKSFITRKGKSTKAYKRHIEQQGVIYDVSKVNNVFDQLVGSALKYTSMNVMWFNYHTGVKNVMKGISDLFIEYYGGEYANRKEFGKGFNKYKNNISDIFSSSLTGIYKTKESAIVNKFHLIYNDHSERFSDKDTGGIGSKLNTWAERGGYFFMSGGEHFLQFVTVFTLLESHRLVNGIMMNINEFNVARELEIAKSILTESELADLEEYVTKHTTESEDNEYKYRHRRLVAEWLSYNGSSLGERRKEFNKQIEENNKSSIEAFKQYPTLESMYEFKDGELTTSDKMSKEVESTFMNRVKALNDSMHGIYNTIDRSVIQNTLSGEIVFQFRKWMRPTWIRYMGDRYNMFSNKDKSTFNERLGKHRSGAFGDFGRFMRSPYVRAKYKAGKDPELNAFVQMFQDYGDFLSNYKYYYNLLSPTQQANVRRTYAFISILVGLTLLVTVAGIGYGDDDDEDIPKWRDWLLYNVSGLQTEYLEVLPFYGWGVFYKRTKENIVPVERQLNNLAKLIYDSAAYPFRDEEERTYQRGQYAGKDKVETDLIKATPVLNKYYKELYLRSNINYFGMYNATATWGR